MYSYTYCTIGCNRLPYFKCMYVCHRQCFVSTSRACGIQGDSWTWWICSTAFPSEVTALAVVALVLVVLLVVLVAAIHTLTARKAVNSIAAYLKTRISLRILSSRPSSSQVNSMCMYVCMYFVNHMYVYVYVCSMDICVPLCICINMCMCVWKSVYLGMASLITSELIMHVCMYVWQPAMFRLFSRNWATMAAKGWKYSASSAKNSAKGKSQIL